MNGARSSGAHGWVCRRDVWRGATASERTHRRIVQAKPVLPSIRIGEIRVIENVEELGAELQTVPLSEMEVLAKREIEVLEARILEHVSSHISELAERWRKHDRASLGIAAKICQRFRGCPRAAAIQRESLRVAGRIAARIGWIIVAPEVRDHNSTARLEV